MIRFQIVKEFYRFDNYPYKFLITSNFPKSFITGKRLLKKSKRHSSLKLKEEGEDRGNHYGKTNTFSHCI